MIRAVVYAAIVLTLSSSVTVFAQQPGTPYLLHPAYRAAQASQPTHRHGVLHWNRFVSNYRAAPTEPVFASNGGASVPFTNEEVPFLPQSPWGPSDHGVIPGPVEFAPLASPVAPPPYPYAYGWFGAHRRYHWSRSFGTRRDYTQWERR